MSEFRQLFSKLCQVGFVVAFVGILMLALMPQTQVPISTGWDKLNHMLAFFTLAMLLDFGFTSLRWWPQQMLFLLGYGISIEFLQLLTSDRSFSVLDVAADSVGMFFYAFVAHVLFAEYRARCRLV